jgi:NADP-dependent 3-hydroxy acid dehydrogenase YdfG
MHENTAIRVTLIEPGGVETPFFEQPGPGRLEPEDVAGAVMWALDQPPHVDVTEVLILPTAQRG